MIVFCLVISQNALRNIFECLPCYEDLFGKWYLMAGNFSFSMYAKYKSQSQTFLYFSSKSLLHCMSVSSICIITGVSSRLILNEAEKCLQQFCTWLEVLEHSAEFRFENRKGCAVFLIVSNLAFHKVWKCVKSVFWRWIYNKCSLFWQDLIWSYRLCINSSLPCSHTLKSLKCKEISVRYPKSVTHSGSLNWGTGFPLHAMHSPIWSFSSKLSSIFSPTEARNLCMVDYFIIFCFHLT
jgi:hypothetical protein